MASTRKIEPAVVRLMVSNATSESPIRSKQPSLVQNASRAEIYSTFRAIFRNGYPVEIEGSSWRYEMSRSPIVSLDCKRMEAAWLALAEEQGWLDGEPTPGSNDGLTSLKRK